MSIPVKKMMLPLAVSGALVSSVAMGASPYVKPDGSWISLSGTVVDPTAETFILDYGANTITVEMDDWDAYGDAYGLLDGDKVTVYGRVDDDFFERDTIEAGTVYVENLNTYFYANTADEESALYSPYHWTATTPVEVSQLMVSGEVAQVDKDDGTFQMDLGGTSMTVETHDLGYNPLDKHGYQQIGKGDWVNVTGTVDYEFIDGNVLHAENVVTVFDS